jgi:hypothetical protein
MADLDTGLEDVLWGNEEEDDVERIGVEPDLGGEAVGGGRPGIGALEVGDLLI